MDAPLGPTFAPLMHALCHETYVRVVAVDLQPGCNASSLAGCVVIDGVTVLLRLVVF